MTVDMTIRRRKIPSEEGFPGRLQELRRVSKGEKVDRRFTGLIVFLMGFSVFSWVVLQFFPYAVPSVLRTYIDRSSKVFGMDQTAYAIVIDAGSTGSRLLEFEFHRNLLTGELILEEELWVEVKPGLGSYADKPEDAAKSIRELLVHVDEKVPFYKRNSTPITLKATAGLRLLRPEQSAAIIESVSNVLDSSGYYFRGVEIMNPMEEGFFGWFTVNYYLGSLGNHHSSYASLDLGGGSTQVTFTPQYPPEELLTPDIKKSHFLHKVTVLKDKLDLYSHSYLGLGLMAVRKAVFDASPDINSSVSAKSPCMGINTQPSSWTYQGVDYYFMAYHGLGDPFQSCMEIVQNVIRRVNVHSPNELKSRRIAAFSYFFDRVFDRGLVPKGSTQSVVKVADFGEQAQVACNHEQNMHNFHCLDFTFMYSLFKDGYGFPDSKEMNICKKINGHEISWALGVAYNMLESIY